MTESSKSHHEAAVELAIRQAGLTKRQFSDLREYLATRTHGYRARRIAEAETPGLLWQAALAELYYSEGTLALVFEDYHVDAAWTAARLGRREARNAQRRALRAAGYPA